MKALITYKEWLIISRGEIRPEIGDRLLLLQAGITEHFDDDGKYTKAESLCNFQECIINSEGMLKLYTKWIENTKHKYYVEIEYNPNEAIEFGQYLYDQIGCENTIKVLYKQFKNT